MAALTAKIVISFCSFSLDVCWEAEPCNSLTYSEGVENIGKKSDSKAKGRRKRSKIEIKSVYEEHTSAE